MNKNAKAVIAAVTSTIAMLAAFGLDLGIGEEQIEQIVIGVFAVAATTGAVWAVPNRD